MPETIKVTVGTLQGTQKGFFLNGKPSSRFTLLAGETYIFDQSDSSNAMHPLRLSHMPDGIHGGGVEFKGGVTVAGVQPGQAGSALTLQLPLGTAALHVYCVSHSGMGGSSRLFVASNANDTIYGALGSDFLQGFAGNDGLWGFDGNDTLDGGAGVDKLGGGAGDDLYVVDSAADFLTENANEGTDTIRSSVSLALVANFENLELTGSSAINAKGNAVANILTGNAAANRLDGSTGADTLIGNGGNDTFVVDNAGDIVLGGIGTDLVESSVTYTLPSFGISNNTNTPVLNPRSPLLTSTSNVTSITGTNNSTTTVVTNQSNTSSSSSTGNVVSSLGSSIENLTLTGFSSINGTGNELANVITGNGAANHISAGAGNDTLDGGAGVDSLIGGAGDDLYVADSAADVLTENANEGTDTIRSSVSLALAANFENLELTGSSAINATGNAVANILTGNAGANQINGAAGADTMRGGAGNDTYNVENSGDVVSEVLNSGTDAVQSSVSHILSADVENLTLTGTAPIDGTGNALANAITGNSAANRISAGAGNDTLDGGAGVDSLIGGAGIDSLMGGLGNDTLAGCFFGANGGRREIDTLVGGIGIDIFQLGWTSGRFYDDGNTANAGRTDYVLITDFTVGQDKLQLDGAAANYYLGASGVTGVTGTGLYAEQGATDELIAIIRSANSTALSATNTVNTGLFV